MARRWFWAEKLRIPVHSAPARPFATCSAHDQSSGSDFNSQYAMAFDAPFVRIDGQRPAEDTRWLTWQDPWYRDRFRASPLAGRRHRGLPMPRDWSIRRGTDASRSIEEPWERDQEDRAHDGRVRRQRPGDARGHDHGRDGPALHQGARRAEPLVHDGVALWRTRGPGDRVPGRGQSVQGLVPRQSLRKLVEAAGVEDLRADARGTNIALQRAGGGAL